MINDIVFNTGESNKELRNRYNPDGSILRKAQLRMLDMLIYIDEICKKEDIEYSLDSGNVLGAVRHDGFIPWDDDVDIILKRKDYNKLCNYLLKHPHPQYKLQTPLTDKWFINHWNVLRDTKSLYIQDSMIHNLRKYRGLQIDIFPIENRTNYWGLRLIHALHARNENLILGKINWLSKLLFYINLYIFIPFIRVICIPFSTREIYTYGYGLPWIDKKWKADDLFPLKKIQFEGLPFPVPNNLDHYLKEQYNRYMDLPPIECRNHHQATYEIYD